MDIDDNYEYKLKCQEVNSLLSTMGNFIDFLEEKLGIEETIKLTQEFNSRVENEK